MRVRPGQRAVGDGAQLGDPVAVCDVHLELREDDLGDAVEQGSLVRRVPVEDHRVAVQCAGKPAHGQPIGPVAVDDLQRGSQHDIPGDLAAAVEGGTTGGAADRGLGHHSGTRSPD